MSTIAMHAAQHLTGPEMGYYISHLHRTPLQWGKFGLIFIFGYMFPSILLKITGHLNPTALWLNILLGWTGIFYILLLAVGIGFFIPWAITRPFALIGWAWTTTKHTFYRRVILPRRLKQ